MTYPPQCVSYRSHTMYVVYIGCAIKMFSFAGPKHSSSSKLALSTKMGDFLCNDITVCSLADSMHPLLMCVDTDIICAKSKLMPILLVQRTQTKLTSNHMLLWVLCLTPNSRRLRVVRFRASWCWAWRDNDDDDALRTCNVYVWLMFGLAWQLRPCAPQSNEIYYIFI